MQKLLYITGTLVCLLVAVQAFPTEDEDITDLIRSLEEAKRETEIDLSLRDALESYKRGDSGCGETECELECLAEFSEDPETFDIDEFQCPIDGRSMDKRKWPWWKKNKGKIYKTLAAIAKIVFTKK